MNKEKTPKEENKTKKAKPKNGTTNPPKSPNPHEMNKNKTFIKSTQMIRVQTTVGKELLSQGYVYYPGIEANI